MRIAGGVPAVVAVGALYLVLSSIRKPEPPTGPA